MINAALLALRRNQIVAVIWLRGDIDGAAIEWPLWLDVLESAFLVWLGVLWSQLSNITQRARREW